MIVNWLGRKEERCRRFVAADIQHPCSRR
jgi:hypothetical protein